MMFTEYNLTTQTHTVGAQQTTKTYQYDHKNRMIAFKDPAGKVSTYAYYPDGLRSQKTVNGTTTQFYYAGADIIDEAVGGQLYASNIRGFGLIGRSSGGHYYTFIRDGHGDVNKILDETGTEVSNYQYDAYGNEIKTGAQTNTLYNPYRYSGEYFDEESGLYYLRARYYSPEIARFISEDSYTGSLREPISLNLYAYCGGNPITFVDPSGHSPQRWGDSKNSQSAREKFIEDTKVLARYYYETAGGKEVHSAMLGMVPVVDLFKDIYESIADRDLVTGELLSIEDKENLFLSMMLPFHNRSVSNAVDAIGDAARGINRSADNIADYQKLKKQLSFEEASSIFTKEGGLKADVIKNSIKLDPVKNQNVILELTKDGSTAGQWYKMTTQSFASPNVNGLFQVHFYQNIVTGKISYYGMKAVFNTSKY